MFTSLMVRVRRFSLICICLLNKTLAIKRADRDKRKTAPMFVVFATPVKGLWILNMLLSKRTKFETRKFRQISYELKLDRAFSHDITSASIGVPKQWNGSHVDARNQSCGSWTLLLRKYFQLFQNLLANGPREWKRSIQMVSRDSF